RVSVSKSRSFHDGHFRRQQQTASSGEGAPARRTCVEKARLDQGQGAGVERLWRDARDRARERLAYRVRGGGGAQYRRGLGVEARGLPAEGGHLPPPLRPLQRQAPPSPPPPPPPR